MKTAKRLTVKYQDRIVGVLAEMKDGFGAFQYDRNLVLVYKCRQKKLNNLYYQMKE
ncbi:MAG: hypothetical protein J6J42_09115 [Lachnospiraceae bacterium]|nr:hypothetical protein [Lachnospiraceae bacterium]